MSAVSLLAQALEVNSELTRFSFSTSKAMETWVELRSLPAWLPEKLQITETTCWPREAELNHVAKKKKKSLTLGIICYHGITYPDWYTSFHLNAITMNHTICFKWMGLVSISFSFKFVTPLSLIWKKTQRNITKNWSCDQFLWNGLLIILYAAHVNLCEHGLSETRS